jgi:phosphate:Na+ symporter
MHLSEDGVQDLEQIYTALQNMTDGTVEAIKSWDEGLAKATLPYEDEIDSLEETLHERHIHRVNSGTCSFMNTEHYVEILSNIERMGDHLTNVLGHIVKEKDSTYDEFNH